MQTHLTNARYKLGRVTKVYKDRDEVVRRVQVAYKNLSESEKLREYAGKKDTKVEKAVQRLVLIVPVDEKDS